MIRNIKRKNGKLVIKNKLAVLIEKSEGKIKMLEKNGASDIELKEEMEWLNKLLKREGKTLRV